MTDSLVDYLGVILTSPPNPQIGDLVYRSEAGGWTTLNPGTPGQALIVGSDNRPAWAGAPARKVSATIGNGSSTSINVTHGLATTDIHVQVWDIASKTVELVPVSYVNTNMITVGPFSSAPASNSKRVVITG